MKINKSYIPFWGLIVFAQAVLRTPENEIEEKEQLEDVLRLSLRSLFLIGGITSTSSTSVNAYNALIELVPHWMAVGGTVLVSAVMLLTIDYSLGIIFPYAANGVCAENSNKKKKIACGILLVVGFSLALASVLMSKVGLDNVTNYSMAFKPSESTSMVAVNSKENKRNDKFLISLDKDIEAARKEDERKLEALKGEFHVKLKKWRRKEKSGHRWASSHKSKTELDSAKSVKNFTPSYPLLVEQKNELIAKREASSGDIIEKISDENKGLKDEHAAKKGIISFLFKLVGCGSTVLAILISFALAFQKDLTPPPGSGYVRRTKKKAKTPSSQEVTGLVNKVTNLDLEVTGLVTIPELVKRIKQNAIHYNNRGTIIYYNNINRDLALLAKRKDKQYLIDLENDLYLTYTIAGFNVKQYY